MGWDITRQKPSGRGSNLLCANNVPIDDRIVVRPDVLGGQLNPVRAGLQRDTELTNLINEFPQ
jgi:hypothetical protein